MVYEFHHFFIVRIYHHPKGSIIFTCFFIDFQGISIKTIFFRYIYIYSQAARSFRHFFGKQDGEGKEGEEGEGSGLVKGNSWATSDLRTERWFRKLQIFQWSCFLVPIIGHPIGKDYANWAIICYRFHLLREPGNSSIEIFGACEHPKKLVKKKSKFDKIPVTHVFCGKVVPFYGYTLCNQYMNGWLILHLRSKQPPFWCQPKITTWEIRRRKSFRRRSRNLQFQQDVRLQLRSHGSEDRTFRDSKVLSRGVSL